VNVRLSPDTLAKIDAWRAKHPESPTRSDVIREGIEALIKLGGLE
jgi:Arc/MetJ-type ribon-helix-helix transcriptional regulator